MGASRMVDLDLVIIRRANEMTESVDQVRLRRHERERDPWAIRTRPEERRRGRRREEEEEEG